MSESRSRIEYLIPTNNIIVLDSYFNFTNKSNLINSLAYFFGATLYMHESRIAQVQFALLVSLELMPLGASRQ